ncbi:MAG: methionyl-tRNA formyltransferase, partial [Rhodobacteraceae bacterium]|nr:methionyl-tRNA formyltransferase [Paracoccaceae bacterium]
YAHKIDKSEARIDWTKTAIEVDRQIRGLSPFPGAWTEAGDARLKLLGSRLGQGSGVAGRVLAVSDAAISVACGTGAVEITRLQRAGRGAQLPGEFLRGYDLPVGTVLGG